MTRDAISKFQSFTFSFIFVLAFAAKDILGFYDNFFRILIERKEIKINVFTFHSLKCQKTKNSNPELYKYVHSKYNTNFNSKAVDLPWGFMKNFFVFGNLEIDSTFVLEDYIRFRSLFLSNHISTTRQCGQKLEGENPPLDAENPIILSPLNAKNPTLFGQKIPHFEEFFLKIWPLLQFLLHFYA